MVANPSFLSDSGPRALASHCAPADVAGDNASASLTFQFDDPASGELALTEAQQQTFRADVARERRNVQGWFAQRHWLADCAPDLRVVVSNRFRISRSLVPAWNGHRGQMEFPAARVGPRKAAIAHELVHVYFPNANRLLAEGLALYVQAEIGLNPAFPNFGKPLHEVARARIDDIAPPLYGDPPDSRARLAPLHLAELDAIATPSPLTLNVGGDFYGEDARGQAFVYSLVGSFAAFLIEARGLAKFRELYLRTPFAPQLCDAGPPGRWSDIYGISLSELEVEWKTAIACGDRAIAAQQARENGHA